MPQMTDARTADPSSAVPFPCQKRGSDSFVLSDDCSRLDDFLPGSKPYDGLCGHPGLLARPHEMGTVIDHHRDCELAPACPANVLGDTKLGISCCDGTQYSYELASWGKNLKKRAPGFCSVENKIKSILNAKPQEIQELRQNNKGCLVRTEGPGWQGCACMDDKGLPDRRLICTISCQKPDCALPDNGIAPTPESWRTSEVPPHLIQPELEAQRKAQESQAAAISPCGLLFSIGAFVQFCLSLRVLNCPFG